MTRRILIKRIVAGLLAVVCVGYAWYVYREQFDQQWQREAMTPKGAPAPASRHPATSYSLTRKKTTRPATTRYLSRTFDFDTGKVTTSTEPPKPEPIDPFRMRRSLRGITGPADTVRTITLSPDNTKLLTGGNDRVIRLFEFAGGKQIRSFAGHTGFVRQVGFSPNANRIISCSDDTTIRIWDANTGEQLSQLDGHQGSVIAASFLGDSNMAVSASKDGTARLWDIDKEVTIKRFDAERQVCAMAVCVPQNRMAIGTHTGQVYLWNLETRTQIRQLEPEDSCIEALVFSPDAQKLVVCPAGAPFRIVDSATGNTLFREDEKEREVVWNGAISSDGKILALGRGLQVIFLDLESYKRFKTFISPAVFNHAICFVPDTSLLITAGGGFLSTNDTWTRPHGEMLQIWNLPKPLP